MNNFTNFKRRGILLSNFIILLIFIFLLNSSLVNAVGLSIPHERSFDFEPGLEFTLTFAALYPTRDTIIKISGEFAEYATLTRDFIPLEDSDKSVTMHVKIPNDVKAEDFTPGTNKIQVEVKDNLSEPSEEEGMFRLSASASAGVNIFVPYPGYYIDIVDYSVKDINSGEDSKLLFTAWNRGKEDLNAMSYDFIIQGNDNNILLEKSGDNINILSQEKQKFSIPLSTYSFSSGYYNATLEYYYLDKVISKTTEFKVGSLNIELVKTTPVLYNGSIQEFEIQIRSDWNDIIKGVYAIVYFNGEEFKTTPADLSNFDTQNLITYIDTSGVSSGNHTLNITLFYSGEKKEESVNIELIEELPEEPVKEPVNYLLIVLIIIIVLLLISMGLFILFYIKRGKEYKNGRKK